VEDLLDSAALPSCGNPFPTVFCPVVNMAIRKWLFAAALLCLPVRLCLAADDLWDDSRYMHVADVHAGMVGYGLTVFTGSKIEKFDVEVIDVLKNLINPKCDVILIMCKGPYLDHVGPVEGMSGSPIYLYADNDKDHLHPLMVGAFAYGWEWAKDPIGGVQPIEYMLKIPTALSPLAEGGAEGSGTGQVASGEISPPLSPPRWSLADVRPLGGFSRSRIGLATKASSDETIETTGAPRLRPLGTPLMTTGLTARAAKELAPMFKEYGLDLLQAAGGSATRASGEDIQLEPGAALVAPLLIGDMEMSAIGTVTEVRGNRIFGFGHEFNNEGPIRLPLGSGSIATVVADVHSSFKLGELSKIVGTLTGDQTVGVCGLVGEAAPMIPVTLRIHYADGSLDQTYHLQSVLHPKFTALAAAAAVVGSLAAVKDLPEYHTLDYDLSVDFANGKSVHIVNKSVNGESSEIAQELALPITAAGENPFARVAVRQITGTVQVSGDAQLADITTISLPKLKFAPGETVKAYVTYRPWRQGEQTLPITFDLPKDLPNGDYQLVVSDSTRYLADQMQAEPFRFTAESIEDVFSVVTDFEAIRSDALYVRLLRQADGVAVGRAAMPRLPASVRTALLASGRSNMTAFVTSNVKTIPTDLVMSGSAEFALTIDHEAHVELSRSGKATTQP
jgi:hypothetical protein